MNEQIYKSIKALPPLDDTVAQVQSVCQDKNSNMKQLSDIIKKDPMLTANILRSANSPLYGFSREIRDIDRAVALFGMATVRGFALYGSIKKTFNINLEPYGITEEYFLNIALKRNSLALHWSASLDKNLKNILMPTSFMMEIGRIVIAKEVISMGVLNEFKTKLKSVKNIRDLTALEVDTIGISNEELTSKILEHWNLERELSDAILYINNPEKAANNIKLSSKILLILKNAINVFGVFGDENMKNSLNLVESYGLSQDDFMNAVNKVSTDNKVDG